MGSTISAIILRRKAVKLMKALSPFKRFKRAIVSNNSAGSSEHHNHLYILTSRWNYLSQLLSTDELRKHYRLSCVLVEHLGNVKIDNTSALSLIVDMDAIDDLDGIVNWLIFFRRDHPKVRVVLVSEHFRAYSDETHRSFLCDASVRLPCGAKLLQEALSNTSTPTDHCFMNAKREVTQ